MDTLPARSVQSGVQIRLVRIDSDGGFVVTGYSLSSPTLDDLVLMKLAADMPTSKEVVRTAPHTAFLDQNFPDPFTDLTTISFRTDAPSSVNLSIHDALGRTIRRLNAGDVDAGAHTINWDGTDGQVLTGSRMRVR